MTEASFKGIYLCLVENNEELKEFYETQHEDVHCPGFTPEIWPKVTNLRKYYSITKAMQYGLDGYVSPNIKDKELIASFTHAVRMEQSYLILERETIATYSRLWQVNLLKNMPLLGKSANVADLFGKWHKPVLILGAGPSLGDNLELVKQLKNKVLTIAAGALVPICVKHGFKPDFIVSIDPGELNYTAYFKDQVLDCPLVYDPVVNWKIPHSWQGPLVMAKTWHVPFLEKFMKRSFGILKPGPSVSNVAFALAYKMGASVIGLLGQDCCFRDNQTYTEGTRNDSKDEAQMYVKDPYGKERGTKNAYLQTAYWFQNVAETIDIPLYNCSFGAKIKNITDIPLEDFVGQFGQSINPKWKFKPIKTTQLSKLNDYMNGTAIELLSRDYIHRDELKKYEIFRFLFLALMNQSEEDVTEMVHEEMKFIMEYL